MADQEPSGATSDGEGSSVVPPAQSSGRSEPAGSDGPGEELPRRRKRRRLLPAPIWQIGKLLIIALIVEYLVLPQLAGTRKAFSLLSGVHPLWVLLGVVLELICLLAYSQMTRIVLPADSDPGLLTIFRIQLTTLSVSHCVPAGSAAGTSLGYRLMTQAGVRGSDSGLAMSLQATGSAVILNFIFWIALIVSIPLSGFSALDLTAGLIGFIFVGIFIVLVLFLRRGESWAHGMIERVGRRMPFVDAEAAKRSLSGLIERFEALETDRSFVVRASIFGAMNWLLDAASLYVFLGAFGYWANPDSLILAFSIARVLAVLPITPGGLGVVEATLTSALVGFGAPRGVAILGVIAYRLIEFWVPIPIGGATYLSLQLHHGQTLYSESTGRDQPRPVRWWRRARRPPLEVSRPAVSVVTEAPERPSVAVVDLGAGATSAGENGGGEVTDLGGPATGPIPERR